MKQSGQMNQEESAFLSMCSPHDRDLLLGRADMTLKDFERILYLNVALGYMEHAQLLNERYEDFAIRLSEQIKEEGEILEKYPYYYFDEQTNACQEWIDDFCNQLSEDRQAYYREKLLGGIKKHERK